MMGFARSEFVGLEGVTGLRGRRRIHGKKVLPNPKLVPQSLDCEADEFCASVHVCGCF